MSEKINFRELEKWDKKVLSQVGLKSYHLD